MGETVIIRGVEVTVEGGSGDGWSRAGWLMQDGHLTNVQEGGTCPTDQTERERESKNKGKRRERRKGDKRKAMKTFQEKKERIIIKNKIKIG